MGYYSYLEIKRDSSDRVWGRRPMTPEMRLRLLGGSGFTNRVRSDLANRGTYVGSKSSPFKERVKDALWVSNMASIFALAGLVTIATIASPAILSFGLTAGTLFAGVALVERRFGKRSIRNRK